MTGYNDPINYNLAINYNGTGGPVKAALSFGGPTRKKLREQHSKSMAEIEREIEEALQKRDEEDALIILM